MEHASRASGAAALAFAAAALAFAAASALTDSRSALAAGLALLMAATLATVRELSWTALLGTLILVIAFVPIRRYDFGSGFPIQLEPYRIVVGLLLGIWICALLANERIRLRRTGFEGPLLLMGAAALGSVLVNPSRVAAVQTEVIKSLSFLASFLLVFLLVATVVRSRRETETLLRILVGGLTVVAALAVVESRTGFSPFTRLNSVLPALVPHEQVVRGTAVRTIGPAEHPIALGAVLVLGVPIALYLARTATRRRALWWLGLATLCLGVLTTLARTGVVMLIVVALVHLFLRPRETIRYWPLILPFLAIVHFAAPGTLGSLRHSFFPEAGVIAEQKRDQGDCDASGRIAELGPTLAEVSAQPLLGIGHGTRIVTGDKANACILDNQALGTLLETGAIGLLAWIWFFARFVRRLGRAAAARTPDGELSAALSAAIAAFGVSMLTYDALGFIQVTFVLFLLAGFGAATLIRIHAADPQSREGRPAAVSG